MAEEFTVLFDVKDGGQGYNGVAAGTKKKKGEALAGVEPVSAKGQPSKVLEAKVCNVNAENAGEACEVAAELYGSHGGTAAAAKVANLAFESK